MKKGTRTKDDAIGFFGGTDTKDISLSLSNWYRDSFLMYLDHGHRKELLFNCSEQAMMYIKSYIFKDIRVADEIKRTPYNPNRYKSLGRQVSNYDEEVWNSVRYKVMKNILWQKFGQNPEIRNYLISTKGKKLVECNPYDLIWGAGLSLDDNFQFESNWRGKNLLGKALMETRKSFVEVGVN